MLSKKNLEKLIDRIVEVRFSCREAGNHLTYIGKLVNVEEDRGDWEIILQPAFHIGQSQYPYLHSSIQNDYKSIYGRNCRAIIDLSQVSSIMESPFYSAIDDEERPENR